MSRNARLAAAPRACDGRLVKVLAEQYRLYVSDPNPNMLALMDERDARVWHFLIGGLDGPYTGGEYIFTLTAPDEFPTKPPRLEFKTTNGVYAQGGAICISVGEFHATDKPGKDGSYGWRPALGMGGFAAQVLNGLICFDKSDQGFGLSVQCNDIKAGFARTSRTRNLQAFPEISARFESMLAEDSSGAAARSILEGRRRLW